MTSHRQAAFFACTSSTLTITWPQALISEIESLTDAAKVYGDVRLYFKRLLDSGIRDEESLRSKQIP
jgi:hypothetical protein